MTPKIPFLFDYVFANILIPNAVKPELAVINYYHSLHSNQLRGNSLFDGHDTLKDQTALTFIFGNSIGTWATSNSGSNFRHPCFKPYMDYFEDSLHFGKRNFSKYVYPIKVTPHFEQFTGFHDNGSKLNGEFFWKHMSKEALDDVKKGKAVILLDYLLENFVKKEWFESLHTAIKMGALPKGSVILVFNSFNAEDVYNSWFTEEQRLIDVKSIPFLTAGPSFHYSANATRRMDMLTFQSSKNKVRKNYFLFHNRRAREHRVALLYKLHQDNLLEKADWSCLEQPKTQSLKRIESEYGFVINEDTVESLKKKLPKSLESEPGATSDNIVGWDVHPDAYKDCYFSICTESMIQSDYQTTTEKVYKSIINFQPFLFYAFPGALEALRSQGFKTFSPWINEDYDQQVDIRVRSKMIVDEIQRLCNMTKEELHNWYWGMEEILVHNHNHLLNYYSNNPLNEKFFTYLINRLK